MMTFKGQKKKKKKRCSASYIIKEMQSKTMEYKRTPIRITQIQNIDITKC